MKDNQFKSELFSPRLTKLFSLLVTVVGLVVLFGWTNDWLFLTRISPEEVPMAPSSAVAFIVLSVGLLDYVRPQKLGKPRYRTLLAALFVICLSGSILIFRQTGSEMKWEHLFIVIPQTLLPFSIGHMSVVTSVMFLMLGFAQLFLLSNRELLKNVSFILTSVTLVSSLLILLGYSLENPFFYSGTMIPPSSLSALSFLLVAISLITSMDVDCYFIAKINPVNTSSKLSVIFLPVVILMILSESIISVRIFPLFHINPAIETFIMTLFFIVVVSFVLPVVARNLGNSLDDATKNLSISEEKFRNLFENSPVGKSMTGIDGSIHVNKSFCEILGYSEDEIKTLTWMNISYPDDIQLSNEYMNALLDGSISVARFEKRYLHKKGNIFWTDVSIYLQRNGGGKPEYFITTISDITDRKIAEDKMRSFNLELENQVSQRTLELNKTIAELEEQSRVFVGRELVMIELKKKIKELEKKVGDD